MYYMGSEFLRLVCCTIWDVKNTAILESILSSVPFQQKIFLDEFAIEAKSY